MRRREFFYENFKQVPRPFAQLIWQLTIIFGLRRSHCLNMTCFLISLQAPRGRLGSVRDCSTAACCDAPFSIWFGSLHLIKVFWIWIFQMFFSHFAITYDNRLHFSSFGNETSELSVIRFEISWASDGTCLASIAKYTGIGWEFVELMNWTARIQC